MLENEVLAPEPRNEREISGAETGNENEELVRLLQKTLAAVPIIPAQPYMIEIDEKRVDKRELLVRLGQASLQRGCVIGAAHCASESLLIRPIFIETHVLTAQILEMGTGILSEASKCYSIVANCQGMDSNPLAKAVLLKRLCIVELKQGHISAACQAGREAVKIFREIAGQAQDSGVLLTCRMEIGEILGDIGEVAEAERELRGALSMAPQSAGIMGILGVFLLHTLPRYSPDDSAMEFLPKNEQIQQIGDGTPSPRIPSVYCDAVDERRRIALRRKECSGEALQLLKLAFRAAPSVENARALAHVACMARDPLLAVRCLFEVDALKRRTDCATNDGHPGLVLDAVEIALNSIQDNEGFFDLTVVADWLNVVLATLSTMQARVYSDGWLCFNDQLPLETMFGCSPTPANPLAADTTSEKRQQYNQMLQVFQKPSSAPTGAQGPRNVRDIATCLLLEETTSLISRGHALLGRLCALAGRIGDAEEKIRLSRETLLRGRADHITLVLGQVTEYRRFFRASRTDPSPLIDVLRDCIELDARRPDILVVLGCELVRHGRALLSQPMMQLRDQTERDDLYERMRELLAVVLSQNPQCTALLPDTTCASMTGLRREGARLLTLAYSFITVASTLAPGSSIAVAGMASILLDLCYFEMARVELNKLIAILESGRGDMIARISTASYAAICCAAEDADLHIPLSIQEARAWLVNVEHVTCFYPDLPQHESELEQDTLADILSGMRVSVPPDNAVFYSWADQSVTALNASFARGAICRAAESFLAANKLRKSASRVVFHCTPLALPQSPGHALLPSTYSLPDLMRTVVPADRLQGMDFSEVRPRGAPSSFAPLLADCGRLCVGVLFGTGIGSNSETRVLAPALAALDRSYFFVVAFAPHIDHSSQYAQRLAESVDRIVVFDPHNSLYENADLIAQEAVHILIDLNGPSGFKTSDVLALRPAPIQMSGLFFPLTPAAEYIDYVLVDSVLSPPNFRQSQHLTLSSYPGQQKLPRGNVRSPAGLPLGPLTAVCCMPAGFTMLPSSHAIPSFQLSRILSPAEIDQLVLSPITKEGHDADMSPIWQTAPPFCQEEAAPFTSASTTVLSEAVLTGSKANTSVFAVDPTPVSLTLPEGRAAMRACLGLPPTDAFVFGCFGPTYKFTRFYIEHVARLVASDPRYHAVITAVGDAQQHIVSALYDILLDQAEIVLSRIHFWKLASTVCEHVRRLAFGVDCLLDTPGTSGLTTVADALWCGIPVVTMPEIRLSSRSAASQLMTVGLPFLIADDIDKFVDTARRIACDPELYSAIRAHLFTITRITMNHEMQDVETKILNGTAQDYIQRCPYDPSNWARCLEHALAEAVRRWACGEVPGSRDIDLH